MKISKKEKLLLLLLAVIFVGIVYYQFVFVKQQLKISALTTQKNELQVQYDELVQTIGTLEQRQAKIESLLSNVKQNGAPYYPTIIQERLILEIDALMSANQISGNLVFTPITSDIVEAFPLPEGIHPKSSLQEVVDEYNANPQAKAALEEPTPLTENTVSIEQLKVALNFSTTYESLLAFMTQIETYERKIVMTNLSITPGANGDVMGTMNLELYAFPKVVGDDEGYYMWPLDNAHGKLTPFSDIGAPVGINTIENLIEATVAQNNFVILLKSITSELPTFMMGLANDKSQASYISSKSASVEEITLLLSQEGSDYVYRYESKSQKYPTDSLGQFTPGDSIHIEVSSEARVTPSDLSGISLKVINHTDKEVIIRIKNDDPANPRIAVVGEGNPVNVR